MSPEPATIPESDASTTPKVKQARVSMSPPDTPGSSNSHGVRFQSSPTTIRDDANETVTKEEAAKIDQIRSSRRRRGSRSRRSPTPFVRRAPSAANSDDSKEDSDHSSTPSASESGGESRRLRQRRQNQAEERKLEADPPTSKKEMETSDSNEPTNDS